MKRVQPTFKEIAPGEWLIRIPADFDGPALPDEIIALQVAHALAHADPEGTRPAPTPGRTLGTPDPSGAERRRLHEEQRLAVLQKQATSQRSLDALTENEGLPRATWTDRGQGVRQQKRRLALERGARLKPFGA